ncbi:TatD family hydrolase, partial [Mangrovimonas sp. AS39]|uniref:TatD family hydrolase n=1 Tax=Mangrovimonas futianensis TaxID=2895523 RepID=UPI001E46B538
EKLVTDPKVVAIGECGLDYFRRRDSDEGGLSEENKIIQKELFEQQIQFAIKYNKPLMLHVRDAYDDALDILQNYKKAGGPEAERLRGNVHFFA